MFDVFCDESGPCLFCGRYGDVDQDKRNIKWPEEKRAQGKGNQKYSASVAVEYIYDSNKVIQKYINICVRDNILHDYKL